MFEELDGKKYDIIYSDPPWSYGNSQFAGNKITSAAHLHYDVMTIKDIKCLPIDSIANNDCLLFMWTSSPHLGFAIDIGREWGFEYITVGFVWDKQRVNPGYYTMSQVELCLIFKKGKIPQPRGARNVRQYLSCKATRHSEKPEAVRQRIDQMFPTQTKIELFARQRVEGWDAWGNEI